MLSVGDEIEIIKDGAMIRVGERGIVTQISDDGKVFYYTGGLALSVNSDKYRIVTKQ